VRPGGCGNDPRAELGAGDQDAVDDFRRYLELAHRRDHDGELTAAEREWLTAYEHPAGDPPA